ncbi:MAG TPA: ATP-binding protein, partial [Candidatus Acidoferrum sp.]|nr:ATP-binding protein [Candidatus Acidoferrum sp.]
LSPIVAYSELLVTTQPDLPEFVRRYLQSIFQSGEDIAHIVSRLREFYRPRSNAEELTMADTNQIIIEVIELTRPRWRDLPQRQSVSIQIRQELELQLPSLLCDPADLRETLTNLIFNAVDALPQGGSITLATRSVSRPVTGEKASSEKQIQIEVRDNGVGMDEKTRRHCMEPFFSTKAKRGGTGLGLAMVYGMMQRHHGAIEIESAPGSGTCVRLTFPVREKAPADAPAPAPNDVQSRSLRILCIDDDVPVQELLKNCLTTLKHEVATASTGKQGVEMFRDAMRRKQPFETVITDFGMPDMDGSQVAKAIKAESPGTPVILMTGWGKMMNDDGEAIREVDAVLGKPPRIKDLTSLLLQFAT